MVWREHSIVFIHNFGDTLACEIGCFIEQYIRFHIFIPKRAGRTNMPNACMCVCVCQMQTTRLPAVNPPTTM